MGSRELVAAVLEDYTTAPITAQERALFAFLAKVIENSPSTTADDVARVRDAGWTDEAIYDAITVCALFQFYNTWIDASGVSDMQPFAYERQAKRLAELGYAYAEEPQPAQSSPRSG